MRLIKSKKVITSIFSQFLVYGLLISSGEIINSSHILALKTLGIEKINVKKKPLIVFYSTGNEISEKNNIPDWKVRNSNIHYIKSLSKNLFFDLNFLIHEYLKLPVIRTFCSLNLEIYIPSYLIKNHGNINRLKLVSTQRTWFLLPIIMMKCSLGISS